MKSNDPEEPSHSSPHDCTHADAVHLGDDYVVQGGKIALLGECTVCGRKFEHGWLHSHDQCYDPEHEDVAISQRPA